MNERIRAREIRLIGADGEQLGVVTPEEGRTRADEEGYDLVEVAPIYDVAEITSLAAAHLAMEYLCVRAAQKLKG